MLVTRVIGRKIRRRDGHLDDQPENPWSLPGSGSSRRRRGPCPPGRRWGRTRPSRPAARRRPESASRSWPQATGPPLHRLARRGHPTARPLRRPEVPPTCREHHSRPVCGSVSVCVPGALAGCGSDDSTDPLEQIRPTEQCLPAENGAGPGEPRGRSRDAVLSALARRAPTGDRHARRAASAIDIFVRRGRGHGDGRRSGNQSRLSRSTAGSTSPATPSSWRPTSGRTPRPDGWEMAAAAAGLHLDFAIFADGDTFADNVLGARRTGRDE